MRDISRSGRGLGFELQSPKVPFSPVPARLAETPAEKQLSWPSRAQRMDPFPFCEAVGMGTGSGMEIQPLEVPRL